MKFTKKIILFILSFKSEIFMLPKAASCRWQTLDLHDYVSYDFFYKRLVLPRSTVRSAILELVSDGFVEKISRNKKPLFRLTSLGKEQVFFFLPAFSKPPFWQKKWWLAVVTGSGLVDCKAWPCKKKKGFIRLRSGVYIGLENISKDLIAEEWGREVLVVSFSKPEIDNNREFASKLWNLEKIKRCSFEIIDQAGSLLKRVTKRKREAKQVKFDFFVILKSAFGILRGVPALPKQLLPDDWPLERLKKSLWQLSEALDKIDYV